jgi:DNA-binding transcriptional LysR family regulator
MTGAAAALNLTQSAVSQAVANLEASINARLIDRGTRPVKLTLLGDIVYKRTVEILDQVNDLDRAIEMHLHDALPMLRLGVVNTVASTVGPHLMRKLDKLAAQWIIWSGFAETTLRSLVERRVDFIITAEDGTASAEFLNIPVFEEPYILVLPKSLRGERSIETLSDAAPMIRFGSQSFIGPAVEAYLQRIGVVPPNHYHLDTSDAVLTMVEEGMGWTISTPLCILKARLNSPRFICALLPGPAPRRRISLVARASENDALADRIAASVREAIIDHCLPGLRAIAPDAIFSTCEE